MNPDQNLIALRRRSLAAMKVLKEKAEDIVQQCNGQVALICYPAETLSPLFQGNPSLRAVVERFQENANLGNNVEALNQALDAIDLEGMNQSQLITLCNDLKKLRTRLANLPNNNQA